MSRDTPSSNAGGGKAPSFREALKHRLRRLFPRRAVAILRLLKPGPLTYSRPCRSWEEALRKAGSYANPLLLEEEYKAARAVKEGRAAYALFGIPRTRLAFRWPLLASLMAVAGWRDAWLGRPLHILDFGGGLGLVYEQHRRFLDTLPKLLWSVVEQPHFVRCGNAEFATDRLRFFETIDEARSRGDFDAALFVSSLGYLENPHTLLEELLETGVPYLVLIAMQFTGNEEDFICVQHMRAPYVTADVPICFISRPKLLALLDKHGYEMFADLGTGYFFRKRSGMSAVTN